MHCLRDKSYKENRIKQGLVMRVCHEPEGSQNFIQQGSGNSQVQLGWGSQGRQPSFLNLPGVSWHVNQRSQSIWAMGGPGNVLQAEKSLVCLKNKKESGVLRAQEPGTGEERDECAELGTV